MKSLLKILFVFVSFLAEPCEASEKVVKPPMGWNSWINFGASVTEAELKETADFMGTKLKDAGWEYVVIDAGWYAPGMVNVEDYTDKEPDQVIDQYGRLIPDTKKYPSSKNGLGLKPLSDYIHGKGLKLGLHIMRGIPIQAVEQNTPIKGTPYYAREIAMLNSQCDWYFGFYGIDMTKPGAQEYYNSIMELYSSWGVDYIKADDLLAPIYAHDETEAISTAIKTIDPLIVLSLSPGPAPIENIKDLRNLAQLWRISDDFWDNWESLKHQFELCRIWQDYNQPGGWADCDMLPLGNMAKRAMRGEPRKTAFTTDEQYTMMSLWSIFRSPLMLGCDLTNIDDFTLKLITNKEVLKINQESKKNRELFNKEGIIAWAASSYDGSEFYIAVFNTNDHQVSNYDLKLDEFPMIGNYEITDIWNGQSLGKMRDSINLDINKHGVRYIKFKHLK